MARFAFGPFVLDPGGQRLLRAGVALDVQPLVFRLLEEGVRRPGEVLDKAQLIALLWPGVHVTEHSLTVAAHKVRHHLGDHADWWATVPRRGFRFDAPVRVLDTAAPGGRESFHGRARELETLDAAWRAGDRAVALVGLGGVGKTRLALQHLRSSERPWTHVALAGVPTAAGFVAAVASALRVSQRGDPIAAVGAALSGRPAGLVLLDNLEQLLPDVAPTIAAWRAASPETRWLVTCRTRGDLADFRVVHVTSLTPEDGRALFYARTAAIGVTLTQPTVEVDALVADLGGLPLAIELAAARAPLLDPAALRRRLGGQQDGDADIRWTWDLLNDTERAVLSRCARFAGGFTVALAEAVVGAGVDVLDVLSRLRDCCLLEPAAMQAQAISGRLRLSPVVRRYALSRLPPDDPARRWFVEAMIERAQDVGALYDSWDAAASRAFEPDIDNWLEAARLAGPDVVRIVLPASRWLRIAGHVQSARELGAMLPTGPDLPVDVLLASAERDQYDAPERPGQVEAVLAAAAVPGEPLAADLYAIACRTLYQLGRPAEALAAGHAGIAHGGPRLPELYTSTATAAMMVGDIEQTRDLVRRGLVEKSPPADARIRPALLNLWGTLAARQGQTDDAIPAFDESLRLSEDHHLATGRVEVLINYATMLQEAGRLEPAIARFGQALAGARHAGDVRHFGTLYANRGLTWMYLDQLGHAERDFLDGLAVASGAAVRVILELNLCSLDVLRGRYATAVARLDERVLAVADPAWHALAFDANLWAMMALAAQRQLEAARSRRTAMEAAADGTPDYLRLAAPPALAVLDALVALESGDAAGVEEARAAIAAVDGSVPSIGLVRLAALRAVGGFS